MQGVHRLANNFFAHFGYNWYWTGQEENMQHGIGIAMSKLSDIVIENILHL